MDKFDLAIIHTKGFWEVIMSINPNIGRKTKKMNYGGQKTSIQLIRQFRKGPYQPCLCSITAGIYQTIELSF